MVPCAKKKRYISTKNATVTPTPWRMLGGMADAVDSAAAFAASAAAASAAAPRLPITAQGRNSLRTNSDGGAQLKLKAAMGGTSKAWDTRAGWTRGGRGRGLGAPIVRDKYLVLPRKFCRRRRAHLFHQFSSRGAINVHVCFYTTYSQKSAQLTLIFNEDPQDISL